MIEVQSQTTEELILEERKDQRDRLEKRAKKLHDEKLFHVQFVKVRAKATDDGYFGGRVLKPGQIFTYDDVVKNGKFPLWIEPVDEVKLEWDSLSESEKDQYAGSYRRVKESPHSGHDELSKELRLLREELNRERELRKEAEDRVSQNRSPFPDEDSSSII